MARKTRKTGRHTAVQKKLNQELEGYVIDVRSCKQGLKVVVVPEDNEEAVPLEVRGKQISEVVKMTLEKIPNHQFSY